MLRHHLIVALRAVRRQKGYVLLNVSGLALGLAVCLLILLWVRDELAYDRHHEKADRIHRIVWEGRFGDNEWKIPLGPAPLAPALASSFPEVEHAVRLVFASSSFKHGDAYVQEPKVLFADSTFFDVFTVRFVAGDLRAALRDPDALVLTTDAAARHFGESDPIGRTMETARGTVYRVTAVVEPIPTQSHFRFDVLGAAHGLPAASSDHWRGWGNAAVYTYLTLRRGVDPAAFQERLDAFVAREVSAAEAFAESGNHYRLAAQPLTDIHLHSTLDAEIQPGGRAAYVYLFAAVGLFILLLAGINYVNLSTARSLRRAREVGVRKALGSRRAELTAQFLVESVALSTAATVLAFGLAELAMPAFNDLSGKTLSTLAMGPLRTMALALTLALGAGILAGLYPAFAMASWQSIDALRGRTGARGRPWLRNGLVALQFAVSIALIAGTLVVHGQLDYMRQRHLGFDREHVLIVNRANALGEKSGVFLDRVRALPQVAGAGRAQSVPGREHDSTLFELEQPARYGTTSLSYVMADPELFDVLKLEMAAGRPFTADPPAGTTAFVINEAAAAAFGWDEPVGRELAMGGMLRGPVVGVVKNFHFQSLHHEVQPLVMMPLMWPGGHLAIRIAGGDAAAAVAALQAEWDALVPHWPLDYAFLDDTFDALYRAEARMASVFTVFTLLALAIASLGLFGLAAYAAEARTREIGVRKVLGATITGIVALLMRDFLKLVLAGFAVAAPVAYVGMNRWLEDFAFRIDPGPGLFLIAGAIALAIALAAVAGQALRAALADPVLALRSE